MTKKDKKLLLIKDLCARLPYGIFANYVSKILFRKPIVGRIYLWSNSSGFYIKKTDKYPDNWNYETYTSCEFGTFKPYLRPMESMTKKEMKEYSKFAHFGNTLGDWTKSIDYLYAHHIDFRGWIKKGLALTAPEGMYDTKSKSGSHKYFPSEFGSYEEYAEYLKKNSYALDAPEKGIK